MKKLNATISGLLFVFSSGMTYASKGLQKCVTSKNNQQYCTVDGKVGKLQTQVSIYNGARWIASGTIVKNSKNSVIKVTESFQKVQAGDSVTADSLGNNELSIKSSFSKPDSY